MYRCPVCQQALNLFTEEKLTTLRCEQGHSFDRHKKGYVNLLLAQNKRSKQPGDDGTMVASRRDFLNEGHYRPLTQKIAELIKSVNAQVILDAGCGEGYYLHELMQQLPQLQAFGFDISKPAIQSASQYKQCQWAVASTASMPYVDASFDLVLSVFSRVESLEFLRVLKPKGLVLFVGPGKDHLMALRKLIYPQIRDYAIDKHQHYFSSHFTLQESHELQVPLALNSNQQIHKLLSMTPHGQRMGADAQTRLKTTEHLQDEADFRLYLYQKNQTADQ